MNEKNRETQPSLEIWPIARLKRTFSQQLLSLRMSGAETLASGNSQHPLTVESDFIDDGSKPDQSTDATKLLERSSIYQVRPPAESVTAPSVSTSDGAEPKEVERSSRGSQSNPVPISTSKGSSGINMPDRKGLFGKLDGSDALDVTPYSKSLAPVDRENELRLLKEQVSVCTKCAELSRCRSRTVFGTGPVSPRLVLLGEAPGADEDRVGEPFVGAAGQLLNKILAACKLNREDIYILNTVKCRPPGNRNPEADELANCWSYTERQLDVLRPEFICCLGLIATRQLLKTDQALGKMRQKFHRYRDSQVVVTYHPAYLLRTESAKKLHWEDMQMLMREMNAR